MISWKLVSKEYEAKDALEAKVGFLYLRLDYPPLLEKCVHACTSGRNTAGPKRAVGIEHILTLASRFDLTTD